MQFSRLTRRDIAHLVDQPSCSQYYFCGKRIDTYYTDRGERYSYAKGSNRGNWYNTLLQAMKDYRNNFDDGDNY